MYRSGTDVQLQATEYFVEMDYVHTGSSDQLSDHWPVGAEFTVTLPEPRAAAAALFALGLLARYRGRRVA